FGALALLALAAVPAVSSATFVPGPPGKIAFASGRPSEEVPVTAPRDDSQARIWVVDSRGGTPVQVTKTTNPLVIEQHRHPSWSPDHTRIVFAAGPAFLGPFALWIVDLRTGQQTE